jgi:uncharacterized OB-fold protein
MANSVRFDLPTPDDTTWPFWNGAAQGRLLIKRCRACSRAHFYPRPFCPYCWSEEVDWEEASGAATLYSWSVVHVNDLPPFAEQVPYIAAIVDLDEGPRLMTNVVECPASSLHAGMSLHVAFREQADGVTVPVFRPDTTT